MEIAQKEFPFAAIQANTRADSWLRMFAEATVEHGPFVPQWMIADALGVSRQCVHVWIQRGRLASVLIGEERFVPLHVANSFITDEKVGRNRPKKLA